MTDAQKKELYDGGYKAAKAFFDAKPNGVNTFGAIPANIAGCVYADLNNDGFITASELAAVIAAAASPPPDLDWDEMAIDDPIALDPRSWAAA